MDESHSRERKERREAQKKRPIHERSLTSSRMFFSRTNRPDDDSKSPEDAESVMPRAVCAGHGALGEFPFPAVSI
jgi:hypothetical protein